MIAQNFVSLAMWLFYLLPRNCSDALILLFKLFRIWITHKLRYELWIVLLKLCSIILWILLINYWDNEQSFININSHLCGHTRKCQAKYLVFIEMRLWTGGEISAMWCPLFLQLESCASDTVSVSFCCLCPSCLYVPHFDWGDLRTQFVFM